MNDRHIMRIRQDRAFRREIAEAVLWDWEHEHTGARHVTNGQEVFFVNRDGYASHDQSETVIGVDDACGISLSMWFEADAGNWERGIGEERWKHWEDGVRAAQNLDDDEPVFAGDVIEFGRETEPDVASAFEREHIAICVDSLEAQVLPQVDLRDFGYDFDTADEEWDDVASQGW